MVDAAGAPAHAWSAVDSPLSPLPDTAGTCSRAHKRYPAVPDHLAALSRKAVVGWAQWWVQVAAESATSLQGVHGERRFRLLSVCLC